MDEVQHTLDHLWNTALALALARDSKGLSRSLV